MLIRCPHCYQSISDKKDYCCYCRKSILIYKRNKSKKLKFQFRKRFVFTDLFSFVKK